MVLAKHKESGAKKWFNRMAWDLLPKSKAGWVEIKEEKAKPPKEVTEILKGKKEGEETPEKPTTTEATNEPPKVEKSEEKGKEIDFAQTPEDFNVEEIKAEIEKANDYNDLIAIGRELFKVKSKITLELALETYEKAQPLKPSDWIKKRIKEVKAELGV